MVVPPLMYEVRYGGDSNQYEQHQYHQYRDVAMPSCHGWCGEPTQYPDTATATPQEVQTQDTINLEIQRAGWYLGLEV